jgi:hypothetical protein
VLIGGFHSLLVELIVGGYLYCRTVFDGDLTVGADRGDAVFEAS